MNSILPIFCFFILINLSAFASGQFNWDSCIGSGSDYTINSTYVTNLNSLLSSLSTNIDEYGFYNGSMGRDTDRANVMALCRGDVPLDMCRDCITNATVGRLLRCPNNKQAILWGGFCMLRYSNELVSGQMASSPQYYQWNRNNATNPYGFMDRLRSLLSDIQVQAANSLHKVYSGTTTIDSLPIYALVQCTPDISSTDCSSCLANVSQSMEQAYERSVGGNIHSPSCNIYFTLNIPFIGYGRLQELVASPTTQLPSAPPTLTVSLPTSPISAPLPSSSSGNGDSKTTRTIIIILSVIVGGLILVILIGVFFRNKIRQNPKEEELPIRHKGGGETKMSVVESLQYDFGQIRLATNDFSEVNKLGQGGFGTVYRGILLNGQAVAVKRLSGNSSQGDFEFKNEAVLLARLQHKNLVKLLGFSIEGTEKLLVYEFLENSSLDHFLFDPAKRSDLDWDTRYKIIGGIAKGLLYLHEDSRLKIIHRDLKPGNVLLDGDMNPKIADFGMARLFVLDETQANTNRIVGTYGYMAPEYAIQGEFSVKSDVFSFGVLVLEIISGQKNAYFHNGRKLADRLISSAWKNWQSGTAANLIDRVLGNNLDIRHQALRCIHIGLLCVQENAVERPSMVSIVLMLSSNTISLPIPSDPAYLSSTGDYDSEVSNSMEQSGTTKSANSFLHEMSITEFYPR